MLAGTDGQVTIIRDTGDIFPQYSHNSTITYIDYYAEQKLILSADLSGKVIMANGTVRKGFDIFLEYD